MKEWQFAAIVAVLCAAVMWAGYTAIEEAERPNRERYEHYLKTQRQLIDACVQRGGIPVYQDGVFSPMQKCVPMETRP